MFADDSSYMEGHMYFNQIFRILTLQRAKLHKSIITHGMLQFKCRGIICKYFKEDNLDVCEL